MKYSTRLSDAVHCLAFIALNPNDDLSSSAIAESIRTNPSYVRTLMAALKQAGLLSARRGKAQPELTRPAKEITLLDVYRAMEGEKPLLHLDAATNPDCGVGMNIPLVLKDAYRKVQDAAEGEMKRITLADILASYHERIAEQAVRSLQKPGTTAKVDFNLKRER